MSNSSNPASFRYPLYDVADDADQKIETTRILFKAYDPTSAVEAGTVMLYMPQSVSFSDSANYSGVDLGNIGITASKTANTVNRLTNSFNNGGVESALSETKNIFGSAWDNAQNDAGIFDNIKNAIIGAGTTANIDFGAISDWSKITNKVVANPNTNTLYSNVDLRSFSFSFTLIAESKEESQQIKRIDDFFRMNLYPELVFGGYIQKFPYLWDIRFMYDDKENTYIPKIHTCFLRSYNSSYNTQGNSFHEGGAPFDMTMELSFIETKTYSKLNVLTGIDLLNGEDSNATITNEEQQQ